MVLVAMILAVAGGAVTHQTQVPLGLTQAPTHLVAGTAVASMVAVRLMTGECLFIEYKLIFPYSKVTPFATVHSLIKNKNKIWEIDLKSEYFLRKVDKRKC